MASLKTFVLSVGILHAKKIRNLIVRRKEKCPAELMRSIKPKFPIKELSFFGYTVFVRKRERDVNKLEPKALEGTFASYTEGDKGYQIHAGWWQLEMRLSRSPIWAQFLTTQTPNLLDEGSQQLGIWHPDDGHQDGGNKEEQGTSTAKKE